MLGNINGLNRTDFSFQDEFEDGNWNDEGRQLSPRLSVANIKRSMKSLAIEAGLNFEELTKSAANAIGQFPQEASITDLESIAVDEAEARFDEVR